MFSILSHPRMSTLIIPRRQRLGANVDFQGPVRGTYGGRDFQSLWDDHIYDFLIIFSLTTLGVRTLASNHVDLIARGGSASAHPEIPRFDGNLGSQFRRITLERRPLDNCRELVLRKNGVYT